MSARKVQYATRWIFDDQNGPEYIAIDQGDREDTLPDWRPVPGTNDVYVVGWGKALSNDGTAPPFGRSFIRAFRINANGTLTYGPTALLESNGSGVRGGEVTSWPLSPYRLLVTSTRQLISLFTGNFTRMQMRVITVDPASLSITLGTSVEIAIPYGNPPGGMTAFENSFALLSPTEGVLVMYETSSSPSTTALTARRITLSGTYGVSAGPALFVLPPRSNTGYPVPQFPANQLGVRVSDTQFYGLSVCKVSSTAFDEEVFGFGLALSGASGLVMTVGFTQLTNLPSDEQPQSTFTYSSKEPLFVVTISKFPGALDYWFVLKIEPSMAATRGPNSILPTDAHGTGFQFDQRRYHHAPYNWTSVAADGGVSVAQGAPPEFANYPGFRLTQWRVDPVTLAISRTALYDLYISPIITPADQGGLADSVLFTGLIYPYSGGRFVSSYVFEDETPTTSFYNRWLLVWTGEIPPLRHRQRGDGLDQETARFPKERAASYQASERKGWGNVHL